MQVASRASAAARARRPGSGTAAVAGLTVAGIAWLAIAGASAWLVFATPMLARLVALQSQGAAGPAVGAVVWGVALTAPACCAILGAARLGGAVMRILDERRAAPPVASRAALLPPGCTVVPRIQLPDGRRIPDVVVGPHGVAFFEPLPPLAAVRRMGDRWEVRFSDRRWRPIENPLQRAARDCGAPPPPPAKPRSATSWCGSRPPSSVVSMPSAGSTAAPWWRSTTSRPGSPRFPPSAA